MNFKLQMNFAFKFAQLNIDTATRQLYLNLNFILAYVSSATWDENAEV